MEFIHHLAQQRHNIFLAGRELILGDAQALEGIGLLLAAGVGLDDGRLEKCQPVGERVETGSGGFGRGGQHRHILDADAGDLGSVGYLAHVLVVLVGRLHQQAADDEHAGAGRGRHGHERALDGGQLTEDFIRPVAELGRQVVEVLPQQPAEALDIALGVAGVGADRDKSSEVESNRHFKNSPFVTWNQGNARVGEQGKAGRKNGFWNRAVHAASVWLKRSVDVSEGRRD